jgi:hypothetical protein
MTQTFTLNDLILGLYNELDQTVLERNNQEDPLWKSEFKTLKEGKNALPKVLFSPKKNLTKKILNAAKHF